MMRESAERGAVRSSAGCRAGARCGHRLERFGREDRSRQGWVLGTLGAGLGTDILYQGAQHLLAQAIEAAVADWIDRHQDCRDAARRRQVVRNGHLPERSIATRVGEVRVQPPRVHDRRPAGQREKFSSAISPPHLRKTKSLEDLIPWFYLNMAFVGVAMHQPTCCFGLRLAGMAGAPNRFHPLYSLTTDTVNENPPLAATGDTAPRPFSIRWMVSPTASQLSVTSRPIPPFSS
jgi:hypothetical protein